MKHRNEKYWEKMWDNIKESKMCIIRGPEKKGVEQNIWRNFVENFLNFIKTINLEMQRSKQQSSSINTKTHISAHHTLLRKTNKNRKCSNKPEKGTNYIQKN